MAKRRPDTNDLAILSDGIMGFKCPGCRKGDCYAHVDEYLNPMNEVQKCRCPDPHQRHGKLRPRK